MVGNEEKIDGKEEKSWINLFSKYYGGTKTGSDFLNPDTITIISIFNFLRGGYYSQNSGVQYGGTKNGYYWSFYAYSSMDAHQLGFYPTWLLYQDGNHKGFGFSLRCVAHSPK